VNPFWAERDLLDTILFLCEQNKDRTQLREEQVFQEQQLRLMPNQGQLVQKD
jgi:hypothetical protein